MNHASDPRSGLRSLIPASYRWQRHLALVTAFIAGGGWLAWSRLDALSAGEWATLPGMLLAINLGEYLSHRFSMHVRRFPLAVYRRHVVEHHAFFTHERMGMDGWDDLAWVLFPPWAMPLLVAGMLPYCGLLWLVGRANLAWLLFLAGVVYYGLYEVTHAITHLPDDHPLGRTRAVRAFTRHHRVHHDPARMRRWNFNFAVPLSDAIFGTRWRGD